jgi:hypothetical protein
MSKVSFSTGTEGNRGLERTDQILDRIRLANQLGCEHYSRQRRFRERLEQWLTLVHVMWPECPARISPDGQYLLVNQANALSLGGGVDVCA